MPPGICNNTQECSRKTKWTYGLTVSSSLEVGHSYQIDVFLHEQYFVLSELLVLNCLEPCIAMWVWSVCLQGLETEWKELLAALGKDCLNKSNGKT